MMLLDSLGVMHARHTGMWHFVSLVLVPLLRTRPLARFHLRRIFGFVVHLLLSPLCHFHIEGQ